VTKLHVVAQMRLGGGGWERVGEGTGKEDKTGKLQYQD